MAAKLMPQPRRLIAARPEHRILGQFHSRLFARPFRGRRSRQLLVLFESARISYASVYPFIMYAKAFADRYDAEIRLLPVETAITRGIPAELSETTHVLAQSWLTDPPERHNAIAQVLAGLPKNTITAYLDTSANADIRLAAPFQDVDLFFKKSLFKERNAHLKPTYGHTNLTDYYGRLLNVPQEYTDWQVPPTILPKLRLAPNFLTAPNLAEGFLAQTSLHDTPRYIDVHARLGGTEKDGWYGEMRRIAETAASGISGLRIVTGSGIPPKRFMNELRAAKLCFSPFGYGELCWRDIEAIMCGAVLLKPDMSHLDTTPDLYRDGETYVAVRWDFADLADKATALLANEELRLAIAHKAYLAARTYLESDGPVSTYAPLFM